MPLRIMTPKSLLRAPEAKSPKEDFLTGKFEEILDDNSVNSKEKIKHVIITSGKIYYDLTKYREENKIKDAAILRLEQFYPYASKKIQKVLS